MTVPIWADNSNFGGWDDDGELGNTRTTRKTTLATTVTTTTKKGKTHIHQIEDIIDNLKRNFKLGKTKDPKVKNVARDYPIQDIGVTYGETNIEIKKYKRCTKEWLKYKLQHKSEKLEQRGKLRTISNKEILEWTRKKLKEKCGDRFELV